MGLHLPVSMQIGMIVSETTVVLLIKNVVKLLGRQLYLRGSGVPCYSFHTYMGLYLLFIVCSV